MIRNDHGFEEFSEAIRVHELRKRAEDVLGSRPDKLADNPAMLSPEAMQAVIHDLRVHQVELEMQNEELRRIQLELVESRERYFDLYDLAPVGYCTLTESRTIIEANLTLSKMLGLSRGALVNQPITRFICKNDQDIYYFHLKQLFKAGTHTCELRIVNHEEQPVWVHLAATICPDANDVPVYRMVVSDIAERKQIEARLIEAKIQAEIANNAKSEFLSHMSHELRTPLNAIIGFAEVIQNSPADTPIKDCHKKLETIITSGWHLTRLIEDILNLSAIEAKKIALRMEAVDISQSLDKCLEMISPLASERRLEVNRNDAAWEGVRIRADAFRLEQVLINLLSNAVKYNRDGGFIYISGIRKAGHITILISDTGEGIREQDIAALFQPFNRLTDRRFEIEGAGIGLSIARQLTELMGGHIGVESVYGQGSTFWVELPVAE